MLQLKNICVTYSYKKVLNGISTVFEEGRIYSLLGENGAGKSTLAHILAGELKPTAGEILINNRPVSFNSPKAALNMGITCVQQHPRLCPSISILDNLKIGLPKYQYKNITRTDILSSIFNIWLPECKPEDSVKDLTEKECFFVSLISAILKNPKLIILDEPPEIPTEKLRLLTKAGITLLIITHNLKEAVEKSDNIILLQNGVIVQEEEASNITEAEIKEKLYGISKTVEIPKCIQQMDISESDIKHDFGNTGYIPSDKTYTASNPNLSILQLVTAFNPTGKQKELENKTIQILQKADVNIKIYEPVSYLSGGMLQRLILERELAENPKTLYMFNPTHGLDVEATEHLYKKLEVLSESGTKIIFGDCK